MLVGQFLTGPDLESEEKRTELDRENPHPRTTSSNIEKLRKMSEIHRELILAERSARIDYYKLKQMARASRCCGIRRHELPAAAGSAIASFPSLRAPPPR